jgi:hypothetical protein
MFEWRQNDDVQTFILLLIFLKQPLFAEFVRNGELGFSADGHFVGFASVNLF